MNHLAYFEALRNSAPKPVTTTSASSEMTSPSTPKVGFMSLPLELRFQIYALLLSIPPHPESSSHHYLSSNSEAPTYVYPAILLASRQINWEATPFLYAANMFVAHPSMLATFPRLRNYYPPMREAKTLVPLIHRFHIQVRLDLPLKFDRKAAAESFSGLDELSIDIVQSMFLGVSYDNLSVFDQVRGVKKLYISGSTTGFEDYMAWLRYAMTSPIGEEVAPYEEESESAWAHIWSGHASLVKSSIPLVEKEE
ncbi:hypothetical protein TARUN_8581 [Trichoderma arundinaceum]|uniref:Uncharacterized protein n=1 Tax=Trichoderma arundinaceum TaxID=490622 RepID=A0A395NC15_TRIAR|nr:hypothetical protein TARUN_8581 [Trichoderma arundinaceum]